jgi:uncharacterized protein
VRARQTAIAVINISRGKSLADRARLARSFGARLAGLLLTSRLDPGEGLWLVPSSGVHTMGMRYEIDVLFLDRDNVVTGCRPSMAPWRTAVSPAGTHSCVELPAGTIVRTGTACGDRLCISGVER